MLGYAVLGAVKAEFSTEQVAATVVVSKTCCPFLYNFKAFFSISHSNIDHRFAIKDNFRNYRPSRIHSKHWILTLGSKIASKISKIMAASFADHDCNMGPGCCIL